MGFNFYGSLQAMENALDNIQAYAPSRNLSDFVSGAESGAENQPADLCFAQPVGFLAAQDLFFEGFGLDLFGIDPAAIIPDLDNDLIALVVGIEPDGSPGWLSRTSPLCCVFNAMSDAVAYQMGQWFGDGVQQALIQIGILTAHDQVNLFATLLCNIADHS